MTLTDAGPLLAQLDKDDSHHATCVAAAQHLPAGPLVTTWPCFTEAIFISTGCRMAQHWHSFHNQQVEAIVKLNLG